MKYKHIVVLLGAGTSVAAGIPDFRSKNTGLYNLIDDQEITEKTDVFDIDFFRKNSGPFGRVMRKFLMGDHEPTNAHRFVKKLEEKGILQRVYTQNIDGLEIKAGIDASLVVEAHGNFRSAKCIDCQMPYPIGKYMQKISGG